MSDLTWRNINPNFSGSSAEMGNAIKATRAAGDIFGDMQKRNLREKYIDNQNQQAKDRLALSREQYERPYLEAEKLKQQQNTAMDQTLGNEVAVRQNEMIAAAFEENPEQFMELYGDDRNGQTDFSGQLEQATTNVGDYGQVVNAKEYSDRVLQNAMQTGMGFDQADKLRKALYASNAPTGGMSKEEATLRGKTIQDLAKRDTKALSEAYSAGEASSDGRGSRGYNYKNNSKGWSGASEWAIEKADGSDRLFGLKFTGDLGGEDINEFISSVRKADPSITPNEFREAMAIGFAPGHMMRNGEFDEGEVMGELSRIVATRRSGGSGRGHGTKGDISLDTFKTGMQGVSDDQVKNTEALIQAMRGGKTQLTEAQIARASLNDVFASLNGTAEEAVPEVEAPVTETPQASTPSPTKTPAPVGSVEAIKEEYSKLKKEVAVEPKTVEEFDVIEKKKERIQAISLTESLRKMVDKSGKGNLMSDESKSEWKALAGFIKRGALQIADLPYQLHQALSKVQPFLEELNTSDRERMLETERGLSAHDSQFDVNPAAPVVGYEAETLQRVLANKEALMAEAAANPILDSNASRFPNKKGKYTLVDGSTY